MLINLFATKVLPTSKVSVATGRDLSSNNPFKTKCISKKRDVDLDG